MIDKKKFKDYFNNSPSRLITYARRPDPLNKKMAMELIQDLIDDKFLEIFVNTKKEDLIMLHHTLGRHIRNTYIHGKKLMEDYPDEHIDELSFEIIENLHDLLVSLNKDGVNITELGRERE